MGLTEVVQSEGWKKFQKKIYGCSAVLFIVGVLFKLAGNERRANVMIVVAVLLVAVIFILSLFKPRGQQDKLNQ